MKINITKQEENYLEMEFGGEDHTLLNILQSSLLDEPDVEIAGYSKPHPLMDRSKLFIHAKDGKDPLEALKRAIESTKLRLDELIEKFETSLTEIEE
jgi:DNA-directed RNA polymerase subunit L